MPIRLFPFLFRRRTQHPAPNQARRPIPTPPASGHKEDDILVRRHFYNERGFQTYASFFKHWNGYITAGHVLTDANDLIPPFARGTAQIWPDGLDAALIGCALPSTCPIPPKSGQDVICIGFPAGSRAPSQRTAKIYMERPSAPDTWIARIISPDEPVVTGMSGGAVVDITTGEPIGIIITRNSPADLNNDRDPDESLDFISLSGVWNALQKRGTYV